jgi:atypical dual specificity phosphatase
MGDEASGDQAAMKGFSWVMGKQVAGMPRPGAKRPLDQDLLFLRDQGVDALVSLTEKPVDPEALGRHGIEALHIPVPDFQAPTQAQLDQYVNAVQGWVGASRHVGTHCAAGLGRTGTFLAALFVARGMDADAAIAEVRRLRPGSVETKEQEQAVREFFARQK